MANSKVSSAEHEKPNKHLPERNVKNEAIIVSQAVGMLLFGAVMVGLLANPFLVIPLFFVPPLFVAYLSVIALLFVEGVVVLKQYRRVDRYRQRITALSVILLLPVFAVIFNTLAAAATLLHAYDIVYVAKLLASPWVLLGLFVVAAVGLLYLWRLIRLPGRLYWEPLPASSLSKTQHKQQERGLRLQRIGFGLFSIPLAIAIAISFAVSHIMVGPDSSFGGNAMFNFMSLAFLCVGIPCIVAGLICFAKSEM